MQLKYVCENCGKVSIYPDTEAGREQGFQDGWDYPPKIYAYKKMSPRTCGDCGIETSLYWKLMTDKTITSAQQLSAHEKEVLQRIMTEPESLYVDEEQE